MFKEIFNEIITITNHDYAGCVDKEGWDRPDKYLNKIELLEKENTLDDMTFSQLVNEYLLDFNDKHIYFTVNQAYTSHNKTCGFRVKWYDDALYVITNIEEKSLKIGDKIISIDGKTIKETSESEEKILRGSIKERQQWETLLNYAKSIEYVNGQNEIKTFTLEKYDIQKTEAIFENYLMEENIYYIKISNLTEQQKVENLLKGSIEDIKKNKNLIVDLRGNGGGNATLLSPLEPIMFAVGEKPNTELQPRLFNCTERNADLFLKICNQVRHLEVDSNTKKMLDFAENIFKHNTGKGFVEVDFSQILETLQKDFKGTSKPEKVIILMDEYTASAAESFIEVCAESSKVTTVGRSTMGINDYSDLVMMEWENKYALSYPISKLKSQSTYHSTFGTGIKPDIYIKWTPEFVLKDKDIEKALELIQQKVNS
ncbi:S41 family peptidase [Psychrobacillus sp. FSL W7-1493]|uniref:S41 family peptidase n=1 Tax=Psychrobacillus sp. FSL W7-1493 TaxID=2921552 RepID=UPI002626A31A|nr:S41 family peptidase [uncultured Psychrobacillus sp.]